jgi:hypothetical protein
VLAATKGEHAVGGAADRKVTPCDATAASVPRNLLLALAVAVLLGAGCQRARPAPHAAPQPPRSGELLPDRIAGFEGEKPGRQGGAVTRVYSRDATRITVTLARFAMSAEQYRGWVETSTAGFPQAALDVPPGEGNGFFQCAGGERPACDLLIQLRSGVHLEIRGGGTSSRQDVEAIARGLPLRALSTSGVSLPP